MRALVTGAAGFIGSHLAERLCALGHEVVAVDCFTPYYDVSWKRANAAAVAAAGAEVLELDLREGDLSAVVEGADVVFHQAGQPGVRESWSRGFSLYEQHNVLATQRLLEAVRASTVRRFVFASSSSVYGNAPAYPTSELDLPHPASPYGVTKLAAEHLCSLYADTFGIPVVSLRYFTVYGPRQRPDMAIHRLIEAALDGVPFPLYGTGEQVRDFTEVADVVEANVRVLEADIAPGTVLNVAGGDAATVNELIAVVAGAVGREVPLEHLPSQPGDVERTGASTERLAAALGWRPGTAIRDGVARQVAWHQQRRALT